MRVTAKVRKVRSDRQGEHYIFTSDVHEVDERAARKRRGKVFAEVGELERVHVAFPGAAGVSSLGVRSAPPKGGASGSGFELADEKVFLAAVHDARQPSEGIYYVPHSKKKKKDGTPVMQKRKTDALKDAYFSIPPWYSEFFALVVERDAKEGGERTVRVQLAVFRAASAAARSLEARTGYQAVSLAVHPDSRSAIGFHIQFRTVKDGMLLGRSGEGGVGRKGLRLAGDVNLALHRFNGVENVPGSWKKIVEERDYDDVAMDEALVKALDEEILDIAGEDGLAYLRDMAKEHVKNWKGKTDIAGRIERAEMKARLDRMELHLSKVSQAFRGLDGPT